MQKASGLSVRTRSTRINLNATKEAVKLALTIAACVLLYKLSHDIATAQRGYEAIGGEPIFAMLPLAVYCWRRSRK